MRIRFAAAFALAAGTFVGCAEEPRPAAETPASPVETTDAEASNVELTDTELDALAEDQKVCAVTGEPLGSMGRPEAVAVTDSKGEKHTVLICCESCREELLENPDEHLAKLAATSGGTPK